MLFIYIPPDNVLKLNFGFYYLCISTLIGITPLSALKKIEKFGRMTRKTDKLENHLMFKKTKKEPFRNTFSKSSSFVKMKHGGFEPPTT